MKIGAAIVFALVLMGSPVFAGLITFDEPGVSPGYGPNDFSPNVPKGTVVTNDYLSLGVLFSSSTAGGGLANLYGYVSNSSYGINPDYPGGNFLAANTAPELGSPGTLTIQFVKPGDATVKGWVDTSASDPLSFWVRDDNGATNPAVSVQFAFYDVLGNQIGSSGNLASSGNIASTFSFTSLAGVSKIVFTDMGADGFQLDNLTFPTVDPPIANPEPGTLSLLGAGFAAVALLSRRLRSR